MANKITKLLPEHEARFGEWRDKWIGIGLQTGDADFETFEKAIKVAYQKANIPFPEKIIRVKSPVVGALAASIARAILADTKHSAVASAVRSAVTSAVDSAVDSAVASAVRSAVASAVRSAVASAVRPAVASAVDSAVASADLRWHEWFGGQFWVGDWGWYGSPTITSFFFDVVGLGLNADIMERARTYQDLCTSVNYFWPNRHFVMVCDRPQAIRRDNQGRLSNDQKMAIEYRDGWGLYALDGVVLDESLWRYIVSQKMTFAEIMKIENADHRAVALKYNPEAILASGADLIDKSERGNELFLIKNTELNAFLEEPSIYFLRMKCPTGRVFVEGVDPEYARENPYADHCQAVALGLTPTQYGFLRNEG